MNSNLILNEDSEDSSAANSNDNCSRQSLDVEPRRIDFAVSERVRQHGGVMGGANGLNHPRRNNQDAISCSTESLDEFMEKLYNKYYVQHNKPDHQQPIPKEISTPKSKH